MLLNLTIYTYNKYRWLKVGKNSSEAESRILFVVDRNKNKQQRQTKRKIKFGNIIM